MPYGGSTHAGDAQSAASQVDRSITPLLQEAMDPNFFYQPSAYASPAYYFPSGT
jgi:YTH domain-containing family protein